MELNIDPDWLIRMAEKEDSRIVSVGGLVTKIDQRIAGDKANMSSITLHNPDIFYTSEIDRCFWCNEPCCRVDLCFEAYLHRDCEPAIGEDLKRLAEANQLTDGDRPHTPKI